MLPKPSWDNRVGVRAESPLAFLCETGANVLGQRAVDCHPGHPAPWMTEQLEIGLSLVQALETRGITGLQVDADDVIDVVL